ncbi:MAG TPA: hypothetical protein VHW26_14025 [Solirubrobacteraceae bacterium]|jgi:hypothetical protein|nr:hypothetical protein [Solirubrobacteraceae bacterium]
MTTAHASTALFTAASLVLVVLILAGFHAAMASSTANRCIAGFVACVVASPLMLVAHVDIAIAMVGLGLAFAVPACVLADSQDDDEHGGGGGSAPVDWDPDVGSDPDLWDDFERDFWSHVERTGRLVTA